ncbi:RNA-binding Raly-like protein [Odocoileus virginianus]|uniref:RNA-binding Raly-like protein n=1 Tax=Odocoileus virginianus TaxID=9874 RepID=A0ABM4HTR1_ODOVR
MAREPRPSAAQRGRKKPWGTAVSRSSYSLDYQLHWEDGACRVYEHQGVPPFLHRVPVRIRRAHLGPGAKGRFSPHRAPRKSQLPPEIKLQTEELHCLRAELSHIKAQVDRLLQRVELMEQRRDQLPGTEVCEPNRGSGSQGSLCRTTEPRQEPRGPRALLEADGSQEHTDPEDAVKNQASDQEGCQ